MISAPSLRPVLAVLAIVAATAGGAWAQDRITLPSPTAIPAADVPADAVVVAIEKMKYQTPEVTIKAGDTVYWINKEVMPHNVAFRKGDVQDTDFKGDMMGKDEAFAITFNQPGTYAYFCTPHPFMRAKVIVE